MQSVKELYAWSRMDRVHELLVESVFIEMLYFKSHVRCIFRKQPRARFVNARGLNGFH